MTHQEAAPALPPVPTEPEGADVLDLRDKDPVAEAVRQNRLLIEELKTDPNKQAVRLYTPEDGDLIQEHKMWLSVLDEQKAGDDTMIISPDENADLRGRINLLTAYESKKRKNNTVLAAYQTYDEEEKGMKRYYVAFKDKKSIQDFLDHQRESMTQNAGQ